MDQSKQRLLNRFREKMAPNTASLFNGLDYVHALGSPLDAWLYTELFWPDFRELEGMVFLADTVEDAEDEARIETALAAYGGDKIRTQLSFNTFVVEELFGSRTGETNPTEDAILAAKLAEMWKARLMLCFPGGRIVTEVVPADTVTGVAVVFYRQTS